MVCPLCVSTLCSPKPALWRLADRPVLRSALREPLAWLLFFLYPLFLPFSVSFHCYII